MKHAQQPTYSFVILTFALILADTLLAWLSVKFVPAGTGGVSLVCIAVAFMIISTLWFGVYGAIAAYIGTLLAGVITSESLLLHPEIALVWALAGLLQVLIPLAAVRVLEVDLAMQKTRDWTILLLFGVLLNTIAGAAWGTSILSLPGRVNFTGVFTTWLISNILITLLIVPPALRLFTERVSRSKLFVKKFWD